jgi:hypothetical protein
VEKNKARSVAGSSTSTTSGGDSAKLQRDAMKLKQKFQATTSQAEQLINTIATDDSWDWARNKGQGDLKLVELRKDIPNAVTDWQRQFLVTDAAQIRKAFAATRLTEEYRAFLLHTTAVDNLAEVCVKLVNANNHMHKM